MDIITGAGQIQSNPFIIVKFIVAPAILTNASALMIMSTSNRFARAVDRGRDLSRQIEAIFFSILSINIDYYRSLRLSVHYQKR